MRIGIYKQRDVALIIIYIIIYNIIIIIYVYIKKILIKKKIRKERKREKKRSIIGTFIHLIKKKKTNFFCVQVRC